VNTEEFNKWGKGGCSVSLPADKIANKLGIKVILSMPSGATTKSFSHFGSADELLGATERFVADSKFTELYLVSLYPVFEHIKKTGFIHVAATGVI
jgi:hypothetical protein